jgi:hypothetical protein
MSILEESISTFILSSINRVNRIKDSIYLDTNAWSVLAKKHLPSEPLRKWVTENHYYIWLSRFQLAELSSNSQLAKLMANLLSEVGVYMVDRGQNEFSGAPWYQVKIEYERYIRLNTDELRNAFAKEFFSGPVRDAMNRVRKDGKAFGEDLMKSISNIPKDSPRNWKEFPERLERWIRSRCKSNGISVNEKSLATPECYAGLRLSYAVLFLRYFINRQSWKPSDYVDYLHAADMAYAGIVITEKNLAECIRQAAKRAELSTPMQVVDINWLKKPNFGQEDVRQS